MWPRLLRSGLGGQQVFFDAVQHIIHEMLPWSAFKGTILLDYLRFMYGPKWWPLWWGDADSAGVFPIMCLERKQTLLSPPARTMWLVTNKWNGCQLSRCFFLTDFVLFSVWNQIKQEGKRTQSTDLSTDSDHRKQITVVEKTLWRSRRVITVFINCPLVLFCKQYNKKKKKLLPHGQINIHYAWINFQGRYLFARDDWALMFRLVDYNLILRSGALPAERHFK